MYKRQANTELSYKWRRDGNLIDRGMACKLSFTDMWYSDAGDYTVEVSNIADTKTSAVMPIHVIQPVSIEAQTAAAG